MQLKQWRWLLGVAGAALLAAWPVRPAMAQDVKVGGVAYAQFGYQFNDTTGHANAFDLTRSYVNVTAKFAGGLATRITSDLYKDDNGSYTLRIKYAYAAYTPGKSPLTFKLGMIHTPWIDWEEHLWGYRMQGTMAVDRAGYMTSSDLGLGIDGAWANQAVNMQVGAYNGEGYHHGVGDKRKDVMGRVSVRLLPSNDGGAQGGLRVSLYGQYGKPTGGGERMRALGMVSYKSKLFTLAAEGGLMRDSSTTAPTARADGRIVSSYGVFNVPNTKAAVIGRVDWRDPDKTVDGDQQTRLIGGVSYQLHDHLRLLADLDYIHYQSTPTPEQHAQQIQGRFQIEFTF